MTKIQAMREHMAVRKAFHNNFTVFDTIHGYLSMMLFISKEDIVASTKNIRTILAREG